MSTPAGDPRPDDVLPGDPGAQAERTRLAWRRTVLAGTVCALLLTRLSLTRGLDAAGATGLALTALGWLALLLLAHRRIRALGLPHLVTSTGRERPPGAGTVRLQLLLTATAVSCVGLGLLGLLLILA